jgi:hypothetical protein
MPFSPLRPLLAALALGMALSGCGKALPGEAGEGGSTAIAPVSPRGAGGLATKNTTRLGGADAATDAAAVALAVYPGLTAASRPQAVTIVDDRDWAVALAASALAAAPLRAPLLYSEGGALPAVSAQALGAMRPNGAPGLGGSQVVEVGPAARPGGYHLGVLRGGGPYEQAAQIAQIVAGLHGGAVHQAIVVAADGPPAMAMPAAGLSAQTGAPILLVTGTGIPAATRAALTRLHRPAIYAVGPPSALSSATLMQLRRYGTAKRIVSPVGRLDGAAAVGAGAVGNAIAVALFSDGSFGWGVDEAGHGLVFANASRPLDAPAAALLSSSGDYGPLLLLESPGPVPALLATYLRDIQPGYSEAPAYRPVHGVYNHGWLIGDERALSATTQAELDTLLEISPRSPTSSSGTAPSTSATQAPEASETEPTPTATSTSSTSVSTSTPTNPLKKR